MNTHNLVCQFCNAEFEAKRSDAKYCSSSCKTMASNERISNESIELISLKYDPKELAELKEEASQIPMAIDKFIKVKSLTNLETMLDFQGMMQNLQKENDRLKVEMSYLKSGFPNSNIILKSSSSEYDKIVRVIQQYYDVGTYGLESSIRSYILNDVNRAIDLANRVKATIAKARSEVIEEFRVKEKLSKNIS